MKNIPQPIQNSVEAYLSETLNSRVGLQGFHPSSGGCINQGGRFDTGLGSYFIKWNSASKYPGMFEVESKGLTILRESKAIHIPKTHKVGDAGDYSYLLMQYVEKGVVKHNYWEAFGTDLAQLHQNTSASFGLDHDNYIGSLPQYNTKHSNWITFFVERRLQPQIKRAFDSRKMSKTLISHFELLFKKLPNLLPHEEKPSLLHGDLWSGNVLINEEGLACLIDPAVYYGNRETELAFTQLFGGFDRAFYSSYNEAFPLITGFDSRIDIYNLYPLLVHVNLFGGGYIRQVEAIVKRFG